MKISRLFLFVLFFHITVYSQSSNDSFIRGADVSFTQQIEDLGGKYKLNGIEKDALDILKANGVNYIRLRLWHTPADINRMRIYNTATDTAAYCGTVKTASYAKKVKARGLKLLLDFHYSDWWADPGKQNKPAAWIGISFTSLKDSVYSYTKKTIEAFRAQNIVPDMVQVGNEITAGMLWPDGRVGGSYDTNWTHFGDLVKAGIQGVKDAMADTTVKIMIHIDRGGDNTTARWFYDRLIAQGVPFDVIGLSYYPWWHGTVEQMKANVNDLAVRYNKDIVLAETAYPWTTLYLNDGMADVSLGSWTPPAGYPITAQGQKAFLSVLTKTLKETTNNKGTGYFYWEPTYISVPPIGSSWEHYTTFDYSGNALGTITGFMNFDTIKSVNVKLRFNTATVPDTLRPNGVVQVRGEIKGIGSNLLPSGELVTGDANTQVLPKNVGGDYWEYQCQMYPADRFEFKLWTGHTSTKQTYWNIGTEGKILTYDSSNLGTRLVIAGVNDTIVPLQFYSNSLVTNVPQFWSPFQYKKDSVGVLFRVNVADLMNKGLFDPAVHGPIVVRGDSISSAGVLSWTMNKVVLNQEPVGVANASFWSGVEYFPKKLITEGSQINYKFFIVNSAFSGAESNISNRAFAFPKSDTTLIWQFFNNRITPTSVFDRNVSLPKESMLFPNYPNPFNPSTNIRYSISASSHVSLFVYNLLGQKVRTLVDEVKNAGEYSIPWSGENDGGEQAASGIYIVCFANEKVWKIQKIVLIR